MSAGEIVTALDDEQLDHCLHALGLTRSNRPYRNHYCADPGSAPDRSWQKMADDGFALMHSAPREGLPYNTWAVADDVADALTHLTRDIQITDRFAANLRDAARLQ